ncbi:MAG: YraN family protein [Oscillospiraceae bacterium]|nr:YraN family protein [Oscillospiraceae bacterium]
MKTSRQIKGKQGENLAAAHLRKRGFVVLAENFHSRYGEIDIVARDAKYLLFVEVKTRGVGMWGKPSEAVCLEKQRKIIQTAEIYMMKNPLNLQPRFDVAEVYLDQHEKPCKLRWLQNAFADVILDC